MKKVLIWAATLLLAMQGSALASDDYLPAIQSKIHRILSRQAEDVLKRSVAEYNKRLGDPTALENTMTKLGYKRADIELVREKYAKALKNHPIRAVYEDGQLILAAQHAVITMTPQDLLDHKFYLNSKGFEWDDKVAVPEALKKLDEFFAETLKVGLHKGLLDAIVPSAWAGDEAEFFVEIPLKASILSLHYTISKVGQMHEELKRLNEEIVVELKKCRGEEHQDYSKRHRRETVEEALSDSVALLTRADAKVQHNVIKSCDSLEEYIFRNTRSIHFKDPDGKDFKDDFGPAKPPLLCTNLANLQACIVETAKADEEKRISDANVKAGYKQHYDGTETDFDAPPDSDRFGKTPYGEPDKKKKNKKKSAD